MMSNYQDRVQLLDPEFKYPYQAVLLHDQLRFVIRLHQATSLHFDFRLELCGTLLSFAIDAGYSWQTNLPVDVGDHNPQYLLNERRIPAGQYGAWPMLVWDYGTYTIDSCECHIEEEIYKRLKKGQLHFNLYGQRIRGNFRLESGDSAWYLERLTHEIPATICDHRSILSGRSLQEI